MEKSAFILRWPGTDYKIWINSCIKKDFGSSQSISNFKHICIAAARNWNNSNKKKSNKGIHLKTSSFQILTTLLWVFFILNSLWRNLGRIFLKCIQRWQRTVEFCPNRCSQFIQYNDSRKGKTQQFSVIVILDIL